MKHLRRKAQPLDAHADDWLMTYADMITLLLCFFAIFLSVTMPKKETGATLQKPKQNVYKPHLFEGNMPFHGIPVADVPTELEKPEPVKVEQTGDRITTIEMNSAAFFDKGSASLSSDGETLLMEVAETLRDRKYDDYVATIEGHTDDVPINTPLFPSNWELSTARAAAVVRFFIEAGIPAPRLRAAGYADTFPKAPNRTADGTALPENQAVNRRVVIKLEKIEKENP